MFEALILQDYFFFQVSKRVIYLQVWSEKDFLSLKKKLACTHPHSHYFKR